VKEPDWYLAPGASVAELKPTPVELRTDPAPIPTEASVWEALGCTVPASRNSEARSRLNVITMCASETKVSWK
jgi:hypothetical protein